MYTVTVGADLRLRPEYGNVTAHVDAHRADSGVLHYCYRLLDSVNNHPISVAFAVDTPYDTLCGQHHRDCLDGAL